VHFDETSFLLFQAISYIHSLGQLTATLAIPLVAECVQ